MLYTIELSIPRHLLQTGNTTKVPVKVKSEINTENEEALYDAAIPILDRMCES